eukprot:6178775-Pleurochrysis_carterae.AAC.6
MHAQSPILYSRRMRSCGALRAPLPKFWITVARLTAPRKTRSHRAGAPKLPRPLPDANRSPTALSCIAYS